jgi:hypothetical protein
MKANEILGTLEQTPSQPVQFKDCRPTEAGEFVQLNETEQAELEHRQPVMSKHVPQLVARQQDLVGELRGDIEEIVLPVLGLGCSRDISLSLQVSIGPSLVGTVPGLIRPEFRSVKTRSCILTLEDPPH